MGANDYKVPEGLHYSKEHEWVKVEDKLARVGVTDYAQDELGDVVYVELPEVGKEVKQVTEEKTKEMELGAVESIKAVSAVYSPLSGKVKEVNKELEDSPELVNSSPYEQGWICVLEPSDLEAELKGLMDAKAYTKFIGSQK
ncbi:MAG: glycine cleavage system protein GcvH [Candidatus Hadarchaeota archaeon]|nr:glycine cleavage system protein GcvH [Candidatus Hadarchaeota archaeon]